MKKIIEYLVSGLIALSLVAPMSVIAATQYTIGSLLQIGDVLGSHILDGTITNADISGTAAISATKVAGGGGGFIVYSNYTKLATSTNLSFATSTNKLSITGQLSVSASTTFSGVEYLWSSGQGASSTALMTDGAGKLSWNLPTIAVSAPTFFVGTSTTYATYTTPAGASELYVKMCGGGGSGGHYNAGDGSAGGISYFGTGTASTTALAGNGGGIGSENKNGGIGGTGGATAVGTEIIRMKGGGGGGGNSSTVASSGVGGSSPFGGGGAAAINTGGASHAGDVPALNGCAGGGGTSFSGSGGGGGAGEYVEFTITSPAATYKYNVGAAGTGNGGDGGTGLVLVQAFYH